MRVIFFGTYNTETTPRVQVLIDGLRARDVEVVECNVPLKVSTAERVAMLKQPWRLPILGWRIAGCWVKLGFRATHLDRADAIIVGHLGQFDIHLAKWLFRRTPIVLDYLVSGIEAAVDRRLQSSGLKDKLVCWLDTAALRLATIVAVDTEEHLQGLPSKYRSKGVVVLVGAPLSWFAAGETHADAKVSKPLKVLFFGNHIPLQGTPTIGRALARTTEPMHVIMVGPGQDKAEAMREASSKKSAAEVEWRDWVNGAELPALVAAQDVCLGIFGDNPKSQRVVPNKVYQGAAAGCAIITSDTPPQRRVLGDAAVFVTPNDDVALALAVDRLAHDPQEVSRLRKAARALAERDFTPAAVVAPLLKKFDT